jgi:hypothetical protein
VAGCGRLRTDSGHDNGEKEEVRTRGQASDDGSTGGGTEDVADTEFKGLQGGERNSQGEGRKVLSPERHNRDEVRSETRRVSGVSGETEDVPTPTARDHKDTGENTDYEKLAKKSKLSGAVKSEMYPTPRASEVAATITVEAALNRVEKTGYKANLEENVALREQEKMFLTPGANEDAAGKPTGKMQRMLGNSPEVRNTGKGTLNPDWVEWLMGYPPGWTDITDLK